MKIEVSILVFTAAYIFYISYVPVQRPKYRRYVLSFLLHQFYRKPGSYKPTVASNYSSSFEFFFISITIQKFC